TALPLGHRHPAERARLLRRWQKPWLVRERKQPWFPLGGELGLGTQRRHGCVRHRDRAGRALLDLGVRDEHRGASDVGSGPAYAPREGVQAVADAERHKGVPGGVELDLVESLPEAVVASQKGRIGVCQPTPLEWLATELDTKR